MGSGEESKGVSPSPPSIPSTPDIDEFYRKLGDLIRRRKPNIKESSLSIYVLNLRVLSRDLFKKPTFSARYFLDFETIKEHLEQVRPLLTTRNNVLTAIIVFLRSVKDFPPETLAKYAKWQSDMRKEYKEQQSQQERNEKEEKNWMTPQDLVAVKTRLQNELLKSTATRSQRRLDHFQQLLILTLYTDIPPVRNDYANVKVIDDEAFNVENAKKEHNYINLATGTLYLCDYKTNKTYGVKTISIPAHVATMIRVFMKERKTNSAAVPDNGFLLQNLHDHSPMTKNGLTKYINKIFAPKKVSTTMLRKMYLSHKYPVHHNLTEMEKDSYVMGHSLNTQQYVYRRKA